MLDDGDAIAALEAVQLALTEVGDGATYIWHRKNGRLSGAIQPTTSFKDTSGQVCRHIVVALTSGDYSRKAEGIACRLSTGVWTLEG
jgi:surface antigen